MSPEQRTLFGLPPAPAAPPRPPRRWEVRLPAELPATAEGEQALRELLGRAWARTLRFGEALESLPADAVPDDEVAAWREPVDRLLELALPFADRTAEPADVPEALNALRRLLRQQDAARDRLLGLLDDEQARRVLDRERRTRWIPEDAWRELELRAHVRAGDGWVADEGPLPGDLILEE